MSERMIERDERGREIVYVSENCVPNSTPLKTIVVRFPGTHNSDFHNSQLPKISIQLPITPIFTHIQHIRSSFFNLQQHNIFWYQHKIHPSF